VARNANIVYFYIYNTLILNTFYLRLRRGGEVQGGRGNLPARGVERPFGLANEGGEDSVVRKVGMAFTQRRTYVRRREWGRRMWWEAKEGGRVSAASRRRRGMWWARSAPRKGKGRVVGARKGEMGLIGAPARS